MDYLKNLGIDAIWLSPFYPSDLADGGYDVIDYRNVDPRLGTMADFDAMAAAAHEAGIKVIVDIVPNHTSNKHKMFIEALAAGRGSAARDRYIFRDGKDRTATSRRPTGRTTSAALHGRACPTANGICTCSPRNSRTGTGKRGRARRFHQTCVSGLTTVPTASAWTWRTAWPRISTAMIWTIMWSGAPTISPKTAPIR